MSLTFQLFLVTVVQTQPLKAGEGSHYAIGVIVYWSHFGTGGRSSKGLFTVPRAAKEAVHCRAAGVVPWLTGGCVCQDSNVLSCGTCLPGQQCPQLQDLPCHRHPVLGTCSSNFWVTRSITGGYSSGQSGQKNTVSLLKTEITCASARDCSDYVSQWMVLLPHRCNFHLEWHSGSVAFPLHFGMDALLLPDSSDFSYTRYSLSFRGLAALGLEHCSCQSCGIILGNSADAQGDRV